MSDLVGNPEDRFSRVEAHIVLCLIGVPRDIDYHSIKDCLQNIKGVKAVHGLTVWCLTLEKNALAVHLAAGDYIMPFRRTNKATHTRDARKSVFGVSDQVGHKPACTDTELG